MGFREWWGELAYWKKGGVIGILIGLLPILNGLLAIRGGSGIFLLSLIAAPSILFFSLLYKLGLLNVIEVNIEYDIGIPIVLGWFLAPFVYLILGIIFGKIYQIYRNKRNE